MLRKFQKLFKNMGDVQESSQLFAETFFASYRKSKIHTERKMIIVDYLTKHFEKGSFSKVKEFPEGKLISTIEHRALFHKTFW